jgi:hypothetical protein
MRSLRKAAILGIAACVVWIAWLAHVDTTTRLAFDDNGYPPEIRVELWLDDAIEGELMRATCTPSHCETAPMLMDKGRHRIRLRVLIDGHASPFTETTIER